jgi:hypothetical protein
LLLTLGLGVVGLTTRAEAGQAHAGSLYQDGDVSYAIRAGTAKAQVGGLGRVVIDIADATGPVGAWDVRVTYDRAVLSLIECAALVGSCDPDFRADALRVAGAKDPGVVAGSSLATITFRCEVAGESEISLVQQLLVVGKQDIRTLDGLVTCASESEEQALATSTATTPTALLPNTGSGFEPEGGQRWAALLLAVCTGALAVLAARPAAAQIRRRASQRKH